MDEIKEISEVCEQNKNNFKEFSKNINNTNQMLRQANSLPEIKEKLAKTNQEDLFRTTMDNTIENEEMPFKEDENVIIISL